MVVSADDAHQESEALPPLLRAPPVLSAGVQGVQRLLEQLKLLFDGQEYLSPGVSHAPDQLQVPGMMDAVGPGTCLGVAVVKVKEIRYNIMTLRQATRQLKSLQRLVILSVEQCDVHRRHGHVRLVVRDQTCPDDVLY